jgi:hypothetical protein
MPDPAYARGLTAERQPELAPHLGTPKILR